MKTNTIFIIHKILIIAVISILFAACGEDDKNKKDTQNNQSGQDNTNQNTQCTEGEKKCDDNTVVKCDDKGEWVIDTQCNESQKCVTENDTTLCKDEIIEPECTTDEEKCENNKVFKCNSSTNWEEVVECSNNENCIIENGKAECKEDIPGDNCTTIEEKCENNNAYLCNENEAWLLKAECASNEICEIEEGIAVCNDQAPTTDCIEGEEKCDFNNAYNCNESGTWVIKTECSTTETCMFENGTADCKEGCTASDSICINESIYSCNEAGEWTLQQECEENTYCLEENYITQCVTKEADICENAIEIGSLPASLSGTNENHSNFIDPDCTGVISASGKDIFYKLTAPAKQILKVVLEPDEEVTADLEVYILEDCYEQINECLIGMDTGLSGEGEQMMWTNESEEEVEIYLVVDAYSYSHTGSYKLTISSSPVNMGELGEECISDIYCKEELSCNSDFEICTKECETDNDCETGFKCLEIGTDSNLEKICLPNDIIETVETGQYCEYDWQCISSLCISESYSQYCSIKCTENGDECPRRMSCEEIEDGTLVCNKEVTGYGELYSECSSNENCIFELDCINGLCTEAVCTTDADCSNHEIVVPENPGETCTPCTTIEDCAPVDSFCVEMRDGRYCSEKCSLDSDCPVGTSCEYVGISSYGCVPVTDLCTTAVSCVQATDGENFCQLPYLTLGLSCTYDSECLDNICFNNACSRSCAENTDCGCEGFICSESNCIFDTSIADNELEPNNDFDTAQKMSINSKIYANLKPLDGSHDKDYYIISLEQGVTISLSTEGLCEANPDTLLIIYGSDKIEIDRNDDRDGYSSAARTSLIKGFTTETAGDYYIEVTGIGTRILSAPYLLLVEKVEQKPLGSNCEFDFECLDELFCLLETGLCSKECSNDNDNDCGENMHCVEIIEGTSNKNVCVTDEFYNYLQFGSDCDYNWQCNSTICYEDSIVGKFCSQQCELADDNCPEDYKCTDSANSGPVCAVETLTGDNCDELITVKEFPYNTTNDNSYYTDFINVSSLCTPYGISGFDVIYQINIPAQKTVVMKATPEDWDISIYLLNTCSSEPTVANCLGGMDNGYGGTAEEIEHENSSSEEIVVYLVVDAWSPGQKGKYTLEVSLKD